MSNEISQLSILNWILEKGIVNEKGEPLYFYDRLFLLDILTDWKNEIVVKACAQVGKSMTFNLKALFAVKNLKFNIIYTMPTDGDVREFVSSKTNKIIQANPQEFAGMETDSIERKELDDRFIFFKGTISKTAAVSTTADVLIHDEVSRSDQSVIETYKSRTKASTYKGRWIFSNPTVERDALDISWKKSDMKEWYVTCSNCKGEQVMTWPESIDVDNKRFKCKNCDGTIEDEVRRTGIWKATDVGEISGYHISHFMCPWISAKEIIEDSQGDPEYFHNFVLGEPYNPGDMQVNRTMILDNWTPKNIETGKWFLGVDVGNIKHFCLGSEKGIIKIGRFVNWQDLDDIMAMYKPTLVIDAMPDNTMSKYYVETYTTALMSFFQENSSNPQMIVWWGENDKKGIVYSHRDRILDQMFDYILRANLLYAVASDKELSEYVKHFETLRRVKVVNNKGIERYIWESTTGVDHYVFATLYYYLATLGTGSGAVMSEHEPEYQLIRNDNVMGDISRIINQANKWQD